MIPKLIALFLFPFILFSVPPKKIPEALKDRYTVGNKIPVIDWYRDDSYSPNKPLFYSKKVVDEYIAKAKKKQQCYYGITDTWLYQALRDFSIRKRSVAIMGSVKPWYESVVIANRGIPYTIEYNKLETDDRRLHLMTVDEYEKKGKKFDVVFSISSFEHDGLGRYGDRLDPDGDLKAMQKVKKMLKRKGVLYLSVPVGRDALVWNVHRVYGKVRLPMLLKGWKVLKTYGFHKSMFDLPLKNNGEQPIFVLKPE